VRLLVLFSVLTERCKLFEEAHNFASKATSIDDDKSKVSYILRGPSGVGTNTQYRLAILYELALLAQKRLEEWIVPHFNPKKAAPAIIGTKVFVFSMIRSANQTNREKFSREVRSHVRSHICRDSMQQFIQAQLQSCL
jgi:hypothetical protein